MTPVAPFVRSLRAMCHGTHDSCGNHARVNSGTKSLRFTAPYPSYTTYRTACAIWALGATINVLKHHDSKIILGQRFHITRLEGCSSASSRSDGSSSVLSTGNINHSPMTRILCIATPVVVARDKIWTRLVNFSRMAIR